MNTQTISGIAILLILTTASSGIKGAVHAQQLKDKIERTATSHRLDPAKKATNRRFSVGQSTIGHRINALPRGNSRIRANSKSYRYYNGTFYQPDRNGGFVVVRAPLGARVRTLPIGYLSFGIGANRYYSLNSVFYRLDKTKGNYVVVEEPKGARAYRTQRTY